MHPILRIQHHLADVWPSLVVQPLEKGDVKVLELCEWLHRGSELHVVADQDGFGAAFDERDKRHWFRLLRCLVDDDRAEYFVAEQAEGGSDAGSEH